MTEAERTACRIAPKTPAASNVEKSVQIRLNRIADSRSAVQRRYSSRKQFASTYDQRLALQQVNSDPCLHLCV